jgi:hypothetical protein
MKSILVKLVSFLVLASAAACAHVDDVPDDEEVADPTVVEVQAIEGNAEIAPVCFYYTCPRTGRSYGGQSDYAARHRCELACGDFCTFDGNICA